MNSQEFVNVVKLVVRDAAVADVLSVLDAPPGSTKKCPIFS